MSAIPQTDAGRALTPGRASRGDIAMGRSPVLALAALILSPALCAAQPADPLVAIQQRLDALEQQNAELRDRLRALEQMKGAKETPAAPDAARLDALEEKVDLETTRLTELDVVKTESAQRIPLRLTGVILFNAFRNSKHANPARDDPYYAAAAAAATPNGGGSLRQSLLGFDQRAHVSDTTELRGEVALAQTVEDWPRIPTAFLATLEPKRPAFEARLEYGHGANGVHSVEFGSAYHHSDTHIAGLSIPSRM